MSRVRGIRFNEREEELINRFLEENSIIDFSTLVRISVLDFIQNPQIKLTPVKNLLKSEVENVRAKQSAN